jgi:hypothetical protein
MAHDGDEHRLKHHQDASTSLGGPFVKTKQLAKMKRPMPRDSSFKDSPPCGGTPEFPDETGCLKLRSLVSQVN